MTLVLLSIVIAVAAAVLLIEWFLGKDCPDDAAETSTDADLVAFWSSFKERDE